MNKKEFIEQTLLKNFYILKPTEAYGLVQDYYMNFRMIYGYPELVRFVISDFVRFLKDKKFDYLCGVETASLPLIGAMSVMYDYPTVYIRTKPKLTGPHFPVEGPYKKGKSIYIIDDVIAKTETTINFAKIAESEGLIVKGIIVMFGKNTVEYYTKEIQKLGYEFYSIFGNDELVSEIETNPKLAEYKNYINALKTCLL